MTTEFLFLLFVAAIVGLSVLTLVRANLSTLQQRMAFIVERLANFRVRSRAWSSNSDRSRLRCPADRTSPRPLVYASRLRLAPGLHPKRRPMVTRSFPARNDEDQRVLRTVSAIVLRLAQQISEDAAVCGRLKGPGSARDKSARLRIHRSLLRDLIGVRVIVRTNGQCYRLIEAIHRRFRHLEWEYDDYVRRPKPNGYQSIHTVVLDDDAHPVEIQVRTYEMHLCAERGSASHGRYKQLQDPAR